MSQLEQRCRQVSTNRSRSLMISRREAIPDRLTFDVTERHLCSIYIQRKYLIRDTTSLILFFLRENQDIHAGLVNMPRSWSRLPHESRPRHSQSPVSQSPVSAPLCSLSPGPLRVGRAGLSWAYLGPGGDREWCQSVISEGSALLSSYHPPS